MDVFFSDTKLKVTCSEDSNWNHFHEEYNHQRKEEQKLDREVKELGQRKANESTLNDEDKIRVSQMLDIAKARKSLAESKRVVAGYYRLQRQNELEKDQIEEELKLTDDDKKRAELKEKLKEVMGQYNMEMSVWEKRITEAEEKLTNLQSKKKRHDDTRSKQLLDEALKEGFVEVAVLVCIVLGLPGVGKTHLKFLLLDKLPPSLRTSTICAETPIRIEIRTISGTKIQNIEGKWNEVDDEGMIDVVARMILEVKPNFVQTKSNQGIFSWIASKFFQPQRQETTATGARPPIFHPNPECKHPSASANLKSENAISGSCRKALDKIMDRLVQSITKLKNASSVSSSVRASSALRKNQVHRSKWVYFIDSGGQPQYHELLPLFVCHISAALCVIRLPDKLDEIQVVEYYDQGQRVGAIQRSQLSAKDTIQSLVNAIQSYSKQEKPPKIIMVGTHVDKLEQTRKDLSFLPSDTMHSQNESLQHCSLACSSVESLDDKNKKLLEMLEPEFFDQLVFYSQDMKQLIFPLNTLNPGEPEKAKAQTIRHAVESSGGRNVKIPIWWYIMELLLQELAKELGRGVLSRAECLEMANLLGINEESFDAALKFFNELNIIKYCPDVLPDVVFMDSQIPLDKVSELVHHSYLLRQPAVVAEPPTPIFGEWKHFIDHGVVSNETLESFPRHYVSDIFSEKDLTKLLIKLLVLAPIPTPIWVNQEHRTSTEEMLYYVMPSLMLTLGEAEIKKRRVPSPIAATLLVRFPHGSRRAGVFCCFVVHLIRYCGWELLLDAKEPLYRNCIKFRLLTSPPCLVTVIDSNSYIEIHTDASSQIPTNEYAGLLPVIKQSILSGICAACSALNYKKTKPRLTFFCPHSVTSESLPQVVKQHTATLTLDRKYWCCDILPNLVGKLESSHLIWFGIPKVPNTPPSTPIESTVQTYVVSTGVSSRIPVDVAQAPPVPMASKSIDSSTNSPNNGKEARGAQSPEITKLFYPTTRSLTLIDWKDVRGRRKRLQLKQLMCMKWKEIGCLLEIPLPVLQAWGTTYRENPLDCINPVLSHWLNECNYSEYYPISWEGLQVLLEDAELSEVTAELKQALANAL